MSGALSSQFAETSVVELAIDRSADRVDTEDGPRGFVGGETRLDVVDEEGRVGRRAIDGLHQGAHGLPEPLIGKGDHRRVAHRGVCF